MCLNLRPCLWSNTLSLPLCVFVCVSHTHTYWIIELVLSAGQSHQSFSDGQSSNIVYANCLLLNMLHQSGLIMTLFRHSALFLQMRPSGWEREGEREGGEDRETPRKQSGTQIQMQVKMSSVLNTVYVYCLCSSGSLRGIAVLWSVYFYLKWAFYFNVNLLPSAFSLGCC